MKLRSLAALLFRLIGAMFAVEGAGVMLAALGDHRGGWEICDNVVFFILGFCCIRYSKKLACLFCKGLDDDSA
jgi:hypothetical protein